MKIEYKGGSRSDVYERKTVDDQEYILVKTKECFSPSYTEEFWEPYEGFLNRMKIEKKTHPGTHNIEAW